MGKKILVQRRGRGTSQFRASSHKRVARAKYRRYPDEVPKLVKAEIIDC